jgi:hypothetical protein
MKQSAVSAVIICMSYICKSSESVIEKSAFVYHKVYETLAVWLARYMYCKFLGQKLQKITHCAALCFECISLYFILMWKRPLRRQFVTYSCDYLNQACMLVSCKIFVEESHYFEP